MFKGNLQKMKVLLINGEVQYYLPVEGGEFIVNDLIGKTLTLTHKETINCISCGVETPKSYMQGYCGSCVSTLAECDQCRVKPELCSYYEGNCRDNAWGEEHCLKDHLVYLSFTGSRKVGISRHLDLDDGYSSRWIDQGATSAIPFLRVSNRLVSGKVEIAIKKHISDRTHWLKMLKLQLPDDGMLEAAKEVKQLSMADIEAIQSEYGLNSVQWVEWNSDNDVKHIKYPVLEYPEKIKSINLDKTPSFTGELVGLKGQYLIFSDGRVINFRKYAGYLVEISF